MLCGVLRVGGRLQHADFPGEGKHPVILPPRHHVTNLIVRRYHGIVSYSGVQAVVYFAMDCNGINPPLSPSRGALGKRS